MKRIQRFAARTLLLKEAALQRGTKCCCTHGYHERRGSCVAFQAVQACWKKIRCPSDSRTRHTSRSRLHILSPAGAAAWLCPTKASVTHGVHGMLLHACVYMCNCVWKFSLSHSLSVFVSSHAVFFSYLHAIFLGWTAAREANGREAERSANAFLRLKSVPENLSVSRLLLIHDMKGSEEQRCKARRACFQSVKSKKWCISAFLWKLSH